MSNAASWRGLDLQRFLLCVSPYGVWFCVFDATHLLGEPVAV